MNIIEMTRKTISRPWPMFRRPSWREGWYVQGQGNSYGDMNVVLTGPGAPTGSVVSRFYPSTEDILAEDWVAL